MNILPDEKVMCHETAFEKSCFDMVTKCRCRKWVHIRGSNPNTGEELNKYDCSDALLPILLIENAQQSRQTGAAVESFRNQMSRDNEQAQRIMAATLLSHQPANGNGSLLLTDER